MAHRNQQGQRGSQQSHPRREMQGRGRPQEFGGYGEGRFSERNYDLSGFEGGYGSDYGQGYGFEGSGYERDMGWGGQHGGFAGSGYGAAQGGYGGGRGQGGGQSYQQGGPPGQMSGGWPGDQAGQGWMRGGGRQQQEHFDPDYQQWRDEQMRSLDEDYRNWRQERYGKFSEEFSTWRKNRDSNRPSEGGGTSGGNKDRNK